MENKESKCPICGEATFLVYGKYPRKDGLCKDHSQDLFNKKIELNDEGIFIDVKTKEILNKNYGWKKRLEEKRQEIKEKGAVIEETTDNTVCIICGEASHGKEVCKACYNEIMNKQDDIDKNLKPWELKDYFYNLNASIYRLKENTYAKGQIYKLFAIAWLVRDLHKDTQLSEVVGSYAQKIIEKRKDTQEFKITEEKEKTDRDTVSIANPKNRASDGHICKSKGEVEIDNILYKFNICHAYGLKVKEIPSMQERTIVADWYIPLAGTKGIYIEYWGMDKQDYQDNKEEKLKIYEKYKDKVKLIEIEKNDINDMQNLEYNLYQKLIDFGWKDTRE